MSSKTSSNIDSDYVLADNGKNIHASISKKKGDEYGPDSWSSKELAKFFADNGLGDYSKKIIAHKITGKLAALLTDDDLREMGVEIVGDRLRFKQALLTLQRKSRYNNRNQVVWEGEERRYFSDAEKDFFTCCGVFPDDPGTYKLTNNHLKIKTVNPFRFGPAQLRCWFEYGLSTIDLAQVKDIDVISTAAPCPQRVFCCSPGRDMVEIHVANVPSKKILLLVKAGEGEYVSSLIMSQVEEAQIIERD